MGGADVLAGTLDVSRIRESTRRGRLWQRRVPARAARRVPLLPHPHPQPHPPRPAATHARADADPPARRADRRAVPRARRAHDGDGQVAARALRRERDLDHARRRRRSRSGQGRGRQDAQPVPRLPDLPHGDGRQPAQGRAVRRTARNRQDVHGQGDGARGRRAVPVRVVDRVPVAVLRRDRPQDPQLLQGAAQGRGRRGRRDRVHRGDRRDRRRAQRYALGAVRRRVRRRCVRRRPARSQHRAQHASEGISGRRQRAADPDAVVRHADGRPQVRRAGGSTA